MDRIISNLEKMIGKHNKFNRRYSLTKNFPEIILKLPPSLDIFENRLLVFNDLKTQFLNQLHLFNTDREHKIGEYEWFKHINFILIELLTAQPHFHNNHCLSEHVDTE